MVQWGYSHDALKGVEQKTGDKSRKPPSYIASAVRKQKMNGPGAWAMNPQSLPPWPTPSARCHLSRVLQPLAVDQVFKHINL